MRKRSTREQHQPERNSVKEGKENVNKVFNGKWKKHSFSPLRRGAARPALFRDRVFAFVSMGCIIQLVVTQIESSIPLVHPRIIQINERFGLQSEGSVKEDIYQYAVEPLLQGEVKKYSRHSFDKDDCKAMHQWQVEYKPSCVPFHEIDMYDSTYLATGYYRNVWWMRDGDGSAAAIKTLAWNRNFTLSDEQKHLKDANTHMVLQSSKFIPNIYAYCVNSAVFDVAQSGSFDDMIMDKKKEQISKWKPKHKLRYAWQMTKGLSDIHSVGNIYNCSAIAHTDIKTNQYLWMDGVFKLNDLNRAEFIRYNKKKKESCAFRESISNGNYRSPEEYTPDADLNEQQDVYSLGNVLWTLLMEQPIWKGVKTKEVKELVRAGHSPVIPADTLANYSSMERAVVHAMKMCFVTDPKERPTAMKVERYLRKKLRKLHVTQV